MIKARLQRIEDLLNIKLASTCLLDFLKAFAVLEVPKFDPEFYSLNIGIFCFRQGFVKPGTDLIYFLLHQINLSLLLS